MGTATPPIKPIDLARIRADFPILSTTAHGKPLVYLDNGATTQKPRAVIDRLVRYYETENANIHRGVYQLSQLATDAYENARHTVAKFINAPDPAECIFVRGTTEGVNLVAYCYARNFVKAGDAIVVSAMEHHSDIVPWQMAAQSVGAKLRVIPINEKGELRLDELEKLLADGRVKIVAVTHLSNSLGTINDIETITKMAHAKGAIVLVDGAQWIAHEPTDVQQLGCDFYTFSGHKLYGPTGIGILWGKRELLEKMPPFHGGGDMIETVSFDETTYAPLPNKFEAGTPDIAGAVGLAAAIDYVQSLGFDVIKSHEHELLEYATAELSRVPGLRIVGTAAKKGGVISFRLDDPPLATLDVGRALDKRGIAVRTGHHCCMPLMARFNIDSTIRATFAVYNTIDEVDALVNALKEIVAGAKPIAVPSPAQSIALPFADSVASTPKEAAEELASAFDMFDDVSAKNDYLMDLAAGVPRTFDQLKHLTQRVPGCMSEVYVVGRERPGANGTFEFVADANAEVVRGLIAIAQRLFSGQRAKDVVAFDVNGFFQQIGLDRFVTNQRRIGLDGMIKRIKSAAQTVATMDGAKGNGHV